MPNEPRVQRRTLLHALRIFLFMVFIVVKFFEVNFFTVIVFSHGIIFLSRNSRNARKRRGCAGVPSGFFLTEIIFSHKFHELSQIIIFYLPQITQIFIAMRCDFLPQISRIITKYNFFISHIFLLFS